MAGGRNRGGGGGSVGARTAADGRTKRLKTAKGRRLSSTRWLTRQLRDPYVAAARSRGFRSRAAFKLIELDDRFRFLKPGASVVDLGAAPGGWSQVAAERIKAGHAGGGRLVAVDCSEMEPLANVQQITLDFLDADAEAVITAALDGKADVVLSDMAAPATGHTQTDHLRIMALLEAAYAFARKVLKPGGVFLGKVLRGGTEKDLLEALKRDFRQVRHIKPPASRKESAEIYVIALGFRGTDD
ncbi:MAG: RlmE family RNA methyltransferase [Alphaproteobacteria bacterium]|nr:RlmE family RNA methyltransferase [Alphaproteobacteria bacterium]